MAGKNNNQSTIWDFLNHLENIDDYSSKELEKVITKLNKAKETIKRKEVEAKKKLEEEELLRKQKEEEARVQAHIEEVTSMELPLDWNNLYLEDERTQGVHADSISDGLILSLTTLGKVDIEYISSVTGADYKTVISTLKGSIYQNPDTWGECFFKGWEMADEYLSGNLMQKYKVAKHANNDYNGYFEENVKAIEKVLPPQVATEDIYITLGSPWVPADIIDDFITHLFGEPDFLYDSYDHRYSSNNDEIFRTIHDETTGTWEIPEKSRFRHSVSVRESFGTERMEALHIIEKTLNMKNVCVMDEVSAPGNDSGKKRVINKTETVAVLEKQKRIIKEFQEWVWTDKQREKRLKDIFENQYSCVRARNYDGSFLDFPGMSSNVNLYPYQKNAVARIIFSNNTLLAHDVGAGKTYVMIAAGQELRRMRLSKKNMYVVPNNIVGQWRDIFVSMYPDSKLLCVEPKVFTPEKRERILEKIRDEDYDGIIIAYSCFEQIPISREYYREELEEKKASIEKIVMSGKKATSRTRKKKRLIIQALNDLTLAIDDDYNTVYFDELGITRLFVDEAHNFKNVPIETQIKSVLGISSTGSKKCKDMMEKVHMVQKKNDGKGVVFATGTPITNSITDAFVMQQYLQSGELALLDIQSFDGWVGMFAEKVTEFEIDVDTSSYRMATRFAKFHNLPELATLFSYVADFHQMDKTSEVPECSGRKDAVISKTQELSDYLKDISNRAENIRKGYVNRREDNMLKITTDGRKAALDLRLVKPNTVSSNQSKVNRCAENVADIYFKTSNIKGTQIVFCDISTPKDGFNIYDELRDRLIYFGVDSEHIAYVHDAATEKKRQNLFDKVRNGEIRIILGSTFKLGMGVNIQDRLIALHHRYEVTFVKRNFYKNTNFFSDKTHICFLKIAWRSPLLNSSRHLATPLFVDWLPTGQWSAVDSAVL